MKDIKEIAAEITKLQESFSAIKKKTKKPTPEEIDKMEKEMEMEKDPAKKKQMMMKLEEMKKMMKGNMGEMSEEMEKMMENMDQRMRYVWDAIYSIGDSLLSHVSVGHLPRLDGGQMKKALNKLGLEDSFNVSVPTIYAKTNHQGTIFKVNLPSKK